MSDEKPIEANNGSEEIRQKLSQLVKRAWSDDQLKQKLLNDPEPLLRENGVEIPAGAEVRVVADKDSFSFQFQPQKPAGEGAELPESALSSVVGGGKYLTITLTQVYVTSYQTGGHG